MPMRKKVSWVTADPVVISNDEQDEVNQDLMTSSTKHAANQFEILSFLENGNGSKIYDVVQKQRNRKYTMEVVPRKSTNHDDSKNTRLHKHSQLKAPSCYLTQLKYSFQTKSRKYFILSHLHKERNLKRLLQTEKVLSTEVARNVIVQIIEAIDKLHKSNVTFGDIHIQNIYFDTSGHVIVKRTYNGQNYWTKSECYSCYRRKCKHRNHNGEPVSDVAIANDFNSVGQLFVHLITGSQHSYSRLDSLDSLTSDFAYLLLRHDVDIKRIKENPFLSTTNWEKVTNEEIDIPEKISRFIIELKQNSNINTTQNSMVKERSSDNSAPPEILVGVRKLRSKTEENKTVKNEYTKVTERSKSCSDKTEIEVKEIKRSNSFSKLFFGSEDSVSDNNAEKQHARRRKSIDVYQKRLAEISKVLDKNREIVEEMEPRRDKHKSANSSPEAKTYLSNVTEKTEPLEFSFEKMYSENAALRTILTKYGLLKDKEISVETPTMYASPSAPTSPKLLTSKRKQRKNKKDKLSKSCNNIHILHEDHSDIDDDDDDVNQKDINENRQKPPLKKKYQSEIALNMLTDNNANVNRHNKNPKEQNSSHQLIDKLNGLGKSKTFYMKRRQSNSTPHSPAIRMKRHFSDSVIKPNMEFPLSPQTTERHLTAPQTLYSLLKSSSTFSQRQTSYDSGLNEPIEDDREEIGFKKRQSVERNDSGLGSSQEREEVRLWRPREPDSSFLEQEDLKIRASETECFDCGAEEIEECFSDSIDHLCKACGKSRIERKEAVIELIETEVNFGEDLQILKGEFYNPLKLNNILTTDEISKLFLNLQELVDVNAKLCASLQHGLEACLEQDDYDFMNLAVGNAFLNNIEFFEAYELYCVKQNESSDLLKVLTKKSDLLRVFLQVSSQENVKLRKMDLKTFLTMPIQRIMKYPLLLSRIHKHTPKRNPDRKALKQAMLKVEEQILRINHLSKNSNTPKMKKPDGFTALVDLDSTNIKDLTKFVANLNEWKVEETLILAQNDFEVIETDLVGLTAWIKSDFKKLSYQKVILAVKNPPEHYKEQLAERLQNSNTPYTLSEIKDAILIFFKQKSLDKCLIQRKVIHIKNCILSQNLHIPIAFELSETDEQTQAFLARNTSACNEWKNTIRFVIDSFKLRWRQRRGGRPNIMTEKLHLET